MTRPHVVNLLVYLALLLVAALEFGLVQTGVRPLVLMTVAFSMSILIAVGYMKLPDAPPIAQVFAIGGIFWLMILLGLTMVDPMTRIVYAVRH